MITSLNYIYNDHIIKLYFIMITSLNYIYNDHIIKLYFGFTVNLGGLQVAVWNALKVVLNC